MGTEASAGGRDESKRMGGARADFVAGLGRKVAAARESLRAAVASPDDSGPREELGRRLHGLSTHAEILHFRALAEALRRARQLLAQAAAGPLGAEVAAGLVRLLDDAPKLAWDEAPPTTDTPLPSSASGEVPTAVTPFLPAVDEEALEPSVRLPLPPVEETRPFTFTPPAPPLREEVAAAERHEAPVRGDDADISLEGTPMLVADDDAGVTWYFADRLRAAGCVVHEALDGRSALARAFATNPALVLLDIQMPGLDGLTLARTLRRDIALRDVALFHTSWREDWLHRTRELSGMFLGGLRKDAKTALVLARAREALRPRLRIGARIAAPGAVQGRLDGVTTHTLLQLVAAYRPDARVVVQDAAFRYELELRQGEPKRAVRFDANGSARSGPRVLGAMLGAMAGRFEVHEARAAVDATLEGSLAAQLEGPLARARAAAAGCTGAALTRVERVALDEDEVAPYVRTTPLFVAEIVARLAAGVSPREMLLDGAVAPALLDDLLADLCARGAVRSVVERDELSIPITIGTPVPSDGLTGRPPGVRRPRAP